MPQFDAAVDLMIDHALGRRYKKSHIAWFRDMWLKNLGREIAMTDIITPLTDDEYTVLEICNQGGSIAPIGRWEQPTKALAARGLLQRYDAMNYGVTNAGVAALDGREAEYDKALAAVLNKAGEIAGAKVAIDKQMQTCAKVLLAAAKASTRVTGDTVESAIKRWGDMIKFDALSLYEEENASDTRSD